MTADIIYSIGAERIRQDEKHPKLPRYILHPTDDPRPSQFEFSKETQQKINDDREKEGEHSWYGIMNEEDAEIFSAETIEELDAELVQSIALRVRMLEQVRAGLVTIKAKQ